MSIRKTPNVRANQFFDKAIVIKYENYLAMDKSPETIDRLNKFWTEWLLENKTEPTDSLYITICRLLEANNNSHLYDEFVKLQKTTRNSLESCKILYGEERGIEKYNNRSKKIALGVLLSPEEKVIKVIDKINRVNSNIEITNEIRTALIELFSKREIDISDNFTIIVDLLGSFTIDIIERWDVIKNSNKESREYFIARYGKEGVAKFNNRKKQLSSQAKLNFKSCIEHWIANGVSLDEAYVERNKHQLYINSKNKYEEPSCRTTAYWISNGETIESATAIVKTMQTRDLSFFILKYGEDIGLLKFTQMIEKRKKTFNDNPNDVKTKINKSRGKTFIQLREKYGQAYVDEVYNKRTSKLISISKESIYFFTELNKLLPEELSTKSMSGVTGKERWVKHDTSLFFLDYVISNCVIEYNGSFWHADPRKFNENDIHPVKKCKIKDIWDSDRKRLDILNSLSYNVLTIWSMDVNADLQHELNKCKKFIYEHIQNTNR